MKVVASDRSRLGRRCGWRIRSEDFAGRRCRLRDPEGMLLAYRKAIAVDSHALFLFIMTSGAFLSPYSGLYTTLRKPCDTATPGEGCSLWPWTRNRNDSLVGFRSAHTHSAQAFARTDCLARRLFWICTQSKDGLVRPLKTRCEEIWFR
jgi:hypothetical protein